MPVTISVEGGFVTSASPGTLELPAPMPIAAARDVIGVLTGEATEDDRFPKLPDWQRSPSCSFRQLIYKSAPTRAAVDRWVYLEPLYDRARASVRALLARVPSRTASARACREWAAEMCEWFAVAQWCSNARWSSLAWGNAEALEGATPYHNVSAFTTGDREVGAPAAYVRELSRVQSETSRDSAVVRSAIHPASFALDPHTMRPVGMRLSDYSYLRMRPDGLNPGGEPLYSRRQLFSGRPSIADYWESASRYAAAGVSTRVVNDGDCYVPARHRTIRALEAAGRQMLSSPLSVIVLESLKRWLGYIEKFDLERLGMTPQQMAETIDAIRAARIETETAIRAAVEGTAVLITAAVNSYAGAALAIAFAIAEMLIAIAGSAEGAPCDSRWPRPLFLRSLTGQLFAGQRVDAPFSDSLIGVIETGRITGYDFERYVSDTLRPALLDARRQRAEREAASGSAPAKIPDVAIAAGIGIAAYLLGGG